MSRGPRYTPRKVRIQHAAAELAAAVRAEAGPQACPRRLRHSFGVAAVTAGVPLPTVAAVLGHADLSTTPIYTTAIPRGSREELKLDAMLGETLSSQRRGGP